VFNKIQIPGEPNIRSTIPQFDDSEFDSEKDSVTVVLPSDGLAVGEVVGLELMLADTLSDLE
jgi:hypothetical protein